VIVYELSCEKNHKFEGWFKDMASFEKQKDGGFISCPLCGSSSIRVVPSTITVMGKGLKKEKEHRAVESIPVSATKMFYDFIVKNSEDVGNRFAEVALKMHREEIEKKNIRGMTTDREEETLRDEGVEFIKIPVPKLDS